MLVAVLRTTADSSELAFRKICRRSRRLLWLPFTAQINFDNAASPRELTRNGRFGIQVQLERLFDVQDLEHHLAVEGFPRARVRPPR